MTTQDERSLDKQILEQLGIKTVGLGDPSIFTGEQDPYADYDYSSDLKKEEDDE